MQALLGLAVSDAALLRAFAEAHPQVVDVTGPLERAGAALAQHGTWGLGFHAHGEMLVRKGPLQGLLGGAIVAQLSDVRARHVVLVAETRQQALRLEDCSPLRYRDWLFAATGADSLGVGFAERVQAELPTYAFANKPHPSAEEATLMLLMAALERMNARDTRDLTTRAIQRAIGAAAEHLRLLAQEARKIGLLVTLHVDGCLFMLAIGRPIWLAHFRGSGDAPRPGRLMRDDHLRALVLGDRTTDGPNWEQLPEGFAAEIDTSCNLVQFPA